MQTFNFINVDGSPITASFTISPKSYYFPSGSSIVNGDIFSSSVSPASFDLVPDFYKVELVNYSTNDWDISSSANTVTASQAIISGSYSTGSLCSVTFNNIDCRHVPGGNRKVKIKPLNQNVGFNENFVSFNPVFYTTDATGSFTVPLVPQAYEVSYPDGRSKTYKILVPASASVNASLCIVTSNKVASVITPQNFANYGYTAAVSDARYLSNATVVSSSISSSFATNANNALTASFLNASVPSASYAVNASTASIANSISFVPNTAKSASVASSSISASYAPIDPAYSASVATVKQDTLITGNTYNITASFAKTASLANAISFTPASASHSNVADTANAISFTPATASFAVSASKAVSASFANSASWAPNQFALATGSTYPVTASWSNNSTTASNAVIATTAITANAISFVPTVAVSASVASSSISASSALYSNTSFTEDINNGLIVYLPFNEGTGSAIRNYSSYGVDATKKEYNLSGSNAITGSGWNTNSKRGGYSQFLNVNFSQFVSASYIEMNNATIADGLSQMTFGIWYQSSGSTTNNGRIVTKFNGGTVGAFSYELFDANLIQVILVNSLAQRVTANITSPSLNDNKWHHIVATFDGNNNPLYVDGKFIGNIPLTGSLNPTTSPLRIGTFENIGFQPTIGYVDEFKLWGRALTANEIQYLYNEGNLENSIYTSATGNNTVSGSTTFLAGITASLQGTSSWASNALTASSINFVPTVAISASRASSSLSASYASTASALLGSISSASYAVTASFALNGGGSGTTITTGSTYPITSSWATIAKQLSSGSGLISYDSVQNVWYSNAPFEFQTGIWDGANGVQAASFDDDHILFDNAGNDTLIFSGVNSARLFGTSSNALTASWAIHALTSSLIVQTSSSFASSSISASYLNGNANGNLATFNQITASTALRVGGDGIQGLIQMKDVANDDIQTLFCDDNTLTWSGGTFQIAGAGGSTFGDIGLWDTVNGQYRTIIAEDGGIRIPSDTTFDAQGDCIVAGNLISEGNFLFNSATGSFGLKINNISGSANFQITSNNNTVELRNSSSAQTFNVYSTSGSATNYKRISLYGSGNDCVLEMNSTGSPSNSGDLLIKQAANHSIKFYTNGTQRWTFGANGDFLPGASTYNIGQSGQPVNNLWVNSITCSTVTAAGSIACNGTINPGSGITDPLNAVIAIVTNDDHFLFDQGGNLSVDFGNRILEGNWSGSITAAQTASIAIQAPSTVRNVNGSTYTISGSDAGYYLRMLSGSVVTVPKSNFVQGTEIIFEQAGASQVVITGSTGVTIRSSTSLTSSAQYAVIGLKCVDSASYTWTLTGDRA